jgi:hypothetical protein
MKLTNRKLVIYVIALIVVALLFLGLFNAREKRTWPFNSGLSQWFSPSVKKLAYDLTSPSARTVNSFLYNINIQYHSIPDSSAVGGGGAVNELIPGIILVAENNGQLLIFHEESGRFDRIDSDEIIKLFSSVRDVTRFDKEGAKYLAFLGTTKESKGCKAIVLYVSKYELSPESNKITLGPKKLTDVNDIRSLKIWR